MRNLTDFQLETLNRWLLVAEHNGPEGLRRVKAFQDHALSGPWRGFRASRLDEAGRVIYVVERKPARRIAIVRITKKP